MPAGSVPDKVSPAIVNLSVRVSWITEDEIVENSKDNVKDIFLLRQDRLPSHQISQKDLKPKYACGLQFRMSHPT